MCGFQCRYGLLAPDGREIVKKLVEAIASFKIIYKVP